jgi:glucosamine--fructose-6-phosphate aminotransferase (isomerizing)
MCGIIGYSGPDDAVEIIMDGLSRLEYRGYDSAGIALVVDGGFAVRRAEGKLAKLRAKQ